MRIPVEIPFKIPYEIPYEILKENFKRVCWNSHFINYSRILSHQTSAKTMNKHQYPS